MKRFLLVLALVLGALCLLYVPAVVMLDIHPAPIPLEVPVFLVGCAYLVVSFAFNVRRPRRQGGARHG